MSAKIDPSCCESGSSKGRRFQILSLDGGGLKGIFTASILVYWEKRRSIRIVDHFDLITGTSTGGIIALGLGLGFSAQEILKFYLEEGEGIFPDEFFGGPKQWIKTKYSDEALNSALEDKFGDLRLGNSRTRLIIPAYNAQIGEVYLFKTAHHTRLENDYLELARDVARATSAAPTFIDPFIKKSGLKLIDGGVWANNPLMVGVTEALGDYMNIPREQISALSIGTTTEPMQMKGVPSSGGIVQWALPLKEYFIRGQEESACNMCHHLLGDRYYRINPTVYPKEFSLDKFSRELLALGEAEYRKHSSNISSLFLPHKAERFNPIYQLTTEFVK